MYNILIVLLYKTQKRSNAACIFFYEMCYSNFSHNIKQFQSNLHKMYSILFFFEYKYTVNSVPYVFY